MNDTTFTELVGLQQDQTDEDYKPCKGYFYRASLNHYANDDVIRTDVRLTKLKRKSCKGCGECDWVNEFIREHFSECHLTTSELVPGQMYELNFSGGEYQEYCGDYSDIEVDFIRVNEHED